MEFTDILKQIIESYGGVGIFIVFLLIICIVSIPVGLPIFLNKKLEKNGKEITKGVTDGMNVIANTLTENMSSQNEILINTLKESQSKLLDTQTNMIGYIMSSVNTIVNNGNINIKIAAIAIPVISTSVSSIVYPPYYCTIPAFDDTINAVSFPTILYIKFFICCAIVGFVFITFADTIEPGTNVIEPLLFNCSSICDV